MPTIYDMIQSMDIGAFDFNLPKKLIARFPAPDRDQSKLMVIDRSSGAISHHRFQDIVTFVGDNDFLVVNNSRVVPARLFGAINNTPVEILVLQRFGNKTVEALTRPAKKFKAGTTISFNEILSATVVAVGDRGKRTLEVNQNYHTFLQSGYAPLPPYIKRKFKEAQQFRDFDLNRYQTIYAREAGSIAAPTAGLHFSQDILERIKAITEILEITLDVGEATFQTISAADIRSYQMGVEQITIPADTYRRIRQLKQKKKLVAVGTTAVRALETAANLTSPKERFSSDLFIYPGYQFQMVNKLITNFHLPKSSLFILVSALAGLELMQEAYRIAIAHQYRFFSYGDAMLIL